MAAVDDDKYFTVEPDDDGDYWVFGIYPLPDDLHEELVSDFKAYPAYGYDNNFLVVDRKQKGIVTGYLEDMGYSLAIVDE